MFSCRNLNNGILIKCSVFIIGLIIISCVLFTKVYAANGDIKDTIYTTDILTQVDGKNIQSYSIDGETLIALEDLENYGYTVYYNDNIRSVFITKTGTVNPDYNPSIERGKVGGTAGYTYETDINAYINGKLIQAYAIDGKMVAKVEEMGISEKLSEDVNTKYQMSYTYDDSKRLLSLFTSLKNSVSYEEAVSHYLSKTLAWEEHYTENIHNENNWLIEKGIGGLPHGGYYNTMNLIYKSGLIVDLESVVNSYYLSNDIEYTFSPDGSKLFFINQVDGVNEYKQIDLTTLMISPSNSDEYLSARYLAGISDFTADVNGVKIPVYSIGGNDAVKFTDLEFCGYDMGLDEKSRYGFAVYNSDKKLNQDKIKSASISGNAKYLKAMSSNQRDFLIYINNKSMIPYDVDGEYYILISDINDSPHFTSYDYQINNTEMNYNLDDYKIELKYIPSAYDDMKIMWDDYFYGSELGNCVAEYEYKGNKIYAYLYEYEYTGSGIPEKRYSYRLIEFTHDNIIAELTQILNSYIYENIDKEYLNVNNYDKLTYYFDFDSVNGILTIKMSDGSKYNLDLNTYLIAK